MLRKLLERLLLTLFLLGATGAITVIAFDLLIHAAYAARIYPSAADVHADVPRVAIVFGAGLERSGGPTPILYDRVATAVELYQRGLVSKLLLTGDNRFVNYNEPEAMRQTALQLGVPDSDLVLDYAGRRTYDQLLSRPRDFRRQPRPPRNASLPPRPGHVPVRRVRHRQPRRRGRPPRLRR